MKRSPDRGTGEEKLKGGWVDAVKMPAPSWGLLAQKINDARPDSSDSCESDKKLPTPA